MKVNHACTTRITTGKMKLLIIVSALFGVDCVDAFSQQSMFARKQSREVSVLTSSPTRVSRQTTLGMYLEGTGTTMDRHLWTSSLPTTISTTSKDTAKLGTLEVPQVGVGTISWSSNSIWKLENPALQAVVDCAYSSNAAFFDTAERYGSHLKTTFGGGWGECESLTRQLLERSATSSAREKLLQPVVATKFTPSPWRLTADSVIQACQESADRLGVESIDLYQIHMPDIVQPFRAFGWDRPKDEIYWDGIAECYHRGLVKNVGVCNYGPTLLMRCQEHLARKGVPLVSNQIGYSLIGRHNGAQETVDKCLELGIQVLAFYPLAMGLLTGKYKSTDSGKLTEQAFQSLVKSKKTKLEERDLKRYAAGMSPLLAVMEVIAKQRKKSVAQVALNYIICKGAIPIPGARSTAQVLDNAGAKGWRMNENEIAMLEIAADNLEFAGFEGAGFKRLSEKFVGYGVEKWALD